MCFDVFSRKLEIEVKGPKENELRIAPYLIPAKACMRKPIVFYGGDHKYINASSFDFCPTELWVIIATIHDRYGRELKSYGFGSSLLGYKLIVFDLGAPFHARPVPITSAWEHISRVFKFGDPRKSKMKILKLDVNIPSKHVDGDCCTLGCGDKSSPNRSNNAGIDIAPSKELVQLEALLDAKIESRWKELDERAKEDRLQIEIEKEEWETHKRAQQQKWMDEGARLWEMKQKRRSGQYLNQPQVPVSQNRRLNNGTSQYASHKVDHVKWRRPHLHHDTSS